LSLQDWVLLHINRQVGWYHGGASEFRVRLAGHLLALTLTFILLLLLLLLQPQPNQLLVVLLGSAAAVTAELEQRRVRLACIVIADLHFGGQVGAARQSGQASIGGRGVAIGPCCCRRGW
jgi:hypothetical protein